MPDYTQRRTTMVDTQVRPADVTKFPVIQAMLTIPRENFVPAARREAAYVGENLELGGGRVILEPRTLAKMLDAVAIEPDDLVLDIGPAYGYSAAVAAHLGEAVVAVEEDETLAREAEGALTEAGIDTVAVVTGPLAEGSPKHGPFDVILIQGAVRQIPAGLTDQLREGGRIVAIFAEGALGTVKVGHKIDGHVVWRYAFNAGAPVLPGFDAQRAFAL